MKESQRTGFSFGLTSGVITTLGLIVGLHSGTHSRLAVLGGILTIAVADAFSDALGIHISEEAENRHTTKEIWESTVFTFLAKFVFALTFALPFLFLSMYAAMIACITWGFFLLALFSFSMAKSQGESMVRVVGEHLFIAVVVIVLTHYLGDWISLTFK